MLKLRFLSIYSFLSAVCTVYYLSCAQVISTEHDFPITAHAFVSHTGTVMLGTAGQLTPDKRFTLSYALPTYNKLVRFTPEEAYVNAGEHKTINPLYGASISHIAPFGHAFAVATHNRPTTVYFTTWPSYEQTATVLTAELVTKEDNDTEQKKQKIAALASNTTWTGKPDEEEEQESKRNNKDAKNKPKKESALFVALTGIPNKLTLGLLLLDTITKKNEEYNEDLQDYSTVEKTEFTWRHRRNDTQRVPLCKKIITLNSPEIALSGSLSALGSTVDMHYDAVLDRVYYAVSATTGDTPESGACGVLVGSLTSSQLVITSIAPGMLFSAENNHVMGTRGIHKHVVVSRVRTLHTSTGYAYIIAVGDVQAQQGVYAFPLVATGGNKATGEMYGHGMLAHKNNFRVSACAPHDSFACDDVETRVGAGKQLPGPITDICVWGDAVFVSVADAQTDQAPGIFHSQVLLDASGKIMAWTPWRRTAGVTKPVQACMYDAQYGCFWYLAPQARSINRSGWGAKTGDIQKFISPDLIRNGGIQGANSFYHTTVGFNQELGKRVSLLVLTGVNTVMLVQTGSDDTDKQLFTPAVGTRSAVYTQGTITRVPDNVQALCITGGALRDLGAITQAEIVTDGIYAWLAVAGAKGLAVLMCPDGTGWPADSGLSRDFADMPANMAFKIVGNYSGIRRLSAKDARLYVLTHEKLDRITVTAQALKTNTIESITLKTIKNYRYFSDMLVLEPLVLLAGNDGLYRSGTGVSVATATGQSDMRWTALSMPQAVGPMAGPAPATRIYAISSTINNKLYSTVYVLNGYVLGSQSQLYRYAVQLDTTLDTTVTDSTVQAITCDTYFFSPQGEYRNFVATDGSLLLASRSARPESSVLVEFWPWKIDTVTKRLKNEQAKRILLSPEAHSIGRPLYDNALGTWVLYGEFGVLLPG